MERLPVEGGQHLEAPKRRLLEKRVGVGSASQALFVRIDVATYVVRATHINLAMESARPVFKRIASRPPHVGAVGFPEHACGTGLRKDCVQHFIPKALS